MTEGLRFVIQQHMRPDDVHWDLMLEKPGDSPLEPLARNGDEDDDWQVNSLLTWRLDTPPEKLSRSSVDAIRIFDHDNKFLAYEGPVNDNTAAVKIADSGTYRLISATRFRLHLRLQGQTVSGVFTLTRTQANYWQLRSESV